MQSWQSIRQTQTKKQATKKRKEERKSKNWPCRGHERQDRMRNCHRLEETKKTQQLNAMWGLGLKTGTEKNTTRNICEIEWGLYFSQKYSTNVKFLVFKINVLRLYKMLKLREAG